MTIIILILSLILNAQTKKNFRTVENDAYGFGEKLEYSIGYKFIQAGEAYFQIGAKPLYIKGRKAYDVKFQVESLKSLEWLYKVKDWYSTQIDVEGIFPWKFEQHVREGKYKRDAFAIFDQSNNMAYTQNDTVKVPDYVHDIVSAFYYVRTLDLKKVKKDSIIRLDQFFEDTTVTLGVKILGRQEIEVKAGKFKTIVIEPLVVDGGLFKNEGRIIIWLSDDDRKIPVKVGTEIIIGFVGAELIRYSGLRGSLDAKIK